MNDARLEEILQPDYLGDLPGHSLEKIRDMRTECQELEAGLSYVRRVIQGRLDIVGAEMTRRAAGDEPGDVAAMVSRLPEILADRQPPNSAGRFTDVAAPADLSGHLAALDRLAPTETLLDITEIDDADLSGLAAGLSQYERDVSARRRLLHDRIDALQAELIRRYRTGEARVDTLLG